MYGGQKTPGGVHMVNGRTSQGAQNPTHKPASEEKEASKGRKGERRV